MKAVSAYGGTQLEDRLYKDVACLFVVQAQNKMFWAQLTSGQLLLNLVLGLGFLCSYFFLKSLY